MNIICKIFGHWFRQGNLWTDDFIIDQTFKCRICKYETETLNYTPYDDEKEILMEYKTGNKHIVKKGTQFDTNLWVKVGRMENK